MSTTRLIIGWTLSIGCGIACTIFVAAWLGLLDSVGAQILK